MEFLRAAAAQIGAALQTDAGAAAIAGAAGGLVRWVTLRESWAQGLAALVVGSVCALYLGPLVEPALRPFVGAISDQSDASGFSSFVVGLGGIGFAGFVIEIIARLRAVRIAAAPARHGYPYPPAPPPPAALPDPVAGHEAPGSGSGDISPAAQAEGGNHG